MLRIENLSTSYDAGIVLRDISLEVNTGEIAALLGINGAGKTTLIRSILGKTRIQAGSIRFHIQDLTRLAPHRIPRLGIGVVPQERRVFPRLTVRENLLSVTAKSSSNSENFAGILRDFPMLASRLSQRAGTLSGGEQQMLAFARAVLAKPKLLLLDEPTEGLMPAMIAQIEERILELKSQGIGILLAEQNLELALNLADRIYVIAGGAILWSGAVDQSSADQLKSQLGLGIE